MWNPKFCNLSSQLGKRALFGDDLFSLNVQTTLSNNNKKLYLDLTLVLYCHIFTDYKTSHCKSYCRIVSSVLSHWHIIKMLYTLSQALKAHMEHFRETTTKKSGKSHTGKGDSLRESVPSNNNKAYTLLVLQLYLCGYLCCNEKVSKMLSTYQSFVT